MDTCLKMAKEAGKRRKFTTYVSNNSAYDHLSYYMEHG